MKQCFYKQINHTYLHDHMQFFETFNIFNLILLITFLLRINVYEHIFKALNFAFTWYLELMLTFACSFFSFPFFLFCYHKSRAILKHKWFLTAFISGVIGNKQWDNIVKIIEKWKIKSLNLDTWLAYGDHLCVTVLLVHCTNGDL